MYTSARSIFIIVNFTGVVRFSSDRVFQYVNILQNKLRAKSGTKKILLTVTDNPCFCINHIKNNVNKLDNKNKSILMNGSSEISSLQGFLLTH
jgi:thioredoxin-related protein